MSARHGSPEVVLVYGSRDWTDPAPIRSDLESLPEGSVVILTNERGAATIARREAEALGLHVAMVRLLWKQNPKSAGYRCNEAMTLLQPSFLFAYPLGDPGTAHVIGIAERECIQVREA